MATPAERRFQQVRAQRAAASAGPGENLAGASSYELMLAKLDADRRRLREIQSIERKIDVKREVLPDYDPWVLGALEGGRGGQDDVLTTVMVWNIDVGAFSAALDIAEYVLKHDLTLPDQYERDVATALVDEIAGAALVAQRKGERFDVAHLKRLESLVSDHDMPDPARAKLHRALGNEYLAAERAQEAIDQYSRALELHDGAGCRRDLDAAERLKKQQEASAS